MSFLSENNAPSVLASSDRFFAKKKQIESFLSFLTFLVFFFGQKKQKGTYSFSYETHTHTRARAHTEIMAPPPQEAVDCVAYLNEAWTPYHSVLASCKQLIAAGFQVCVCVCVVCVRARFFFKAVGA